MTGLKTKFTLPNKVNGLRMPWFRRRQPQKASATELAAILYRLFIEEHQQFDDPAHYRVPEHLWPTYWEKMQTHREASILLVLLSRTENQPSYEPLLRAYEALIFPATPAEGAAKIKAIKNAMGTLSELSGSDRWLTWSKAWLAEIGHETEDPISFMEFSLHWATRLTILGEAVDKAWS
jgi:hypothetical protein